MRYHGLGSGIMRALAAWPENDFVSGSLFTATVHRHNLLDTTTPSEQTSEECRNNVGGTSGKILTAVQQSANITIRELAALIDISERSVERNIQKLQDEGRLRRIGPTKGGHWEIPE